jgi:hypothetical protein
MRYGFATNDVAFVSDGKLPLQTPADSPAGWGLYVAASVAGLVFHAGQARRQTSPFQGARHPHIQSPTGAQPGPRTTSSPPKSVTWISLRRECRGGRVISPVAIRMTWNGVADHVGGVVLTFRTSRGHGKTLRRNPPKSDEVQQD